MIIEVPGELLRRTLSDGILSKKSHAEEVVTPPIARLALGRRIKRARD